MSPRRWGAKLSAQWIMLLMDSWSLIAYTNITALALRKYVGGTVASKRSMPAVSYRVIWKIKSTGTLQSIFMLLKSYFQCGYTVINLLPIVNDQVPIFGTTTVHVSPQY